MELIKIVGSGMILASSAWTGLRAALCLRRTQEQLRELCAALELMAGEVSFAATPFVPLCRRAGAGRCEAVRGFFEALAAEAELPEHATVGMTQRACAAAKLVLPGRTLSAMERLFDAYGRFDRAGQLRQIELVSEELRQLTAELSVQLRDRCRSYELLGLTAGAAVLVLVI